MHYTAQSNSLGCARVLIDSGLVDINAKDFVGWTPLHVAAKNCADLVIKALLDSPGIDLNAQNAFKQTPIVLSIIENDIEAVKLFITHPDLNLTLADKVLGF